jgi:hypothetical protein
MYGSDYKQNAFTGYEALAMGIVNQAVRDYMNAVITLKNQPNSMNAKRMLGQAKAFFGSQWYSELCRLDGEWLMRKIEREIVMLEKQRAGRKGRKL